MNTDPFFDIDGDASSFVLPLRKWRELLFIGALRLDGELYVRDPARFMPPFDDPQLFAEGFGYRVEPETGRRGEWVRITRIALG